MKRKDNIVVISLGGSLIVPDQIDVVFLRHFRALLLRLIRKGWRFVIITGGGQTARRHQEAAQKIAKLTSKDIDWLGIHGTRLNAHLLRTLFSTVAHPRVITHALEPIRFRERVLVAGGGEPGASTDYDAVLLAKNLGIKKIVNLTNIDFVYDKDPRRFKGARPISEISWTEFRRMIPKKWNPGIHAPFDPVASRAASRLGLEVVIMNGARLDEFEGYLMGKEFTGTKIGPHAF